MKYAINYRERHTRPLWKALVYESLRLVCVGLTLAAVVGIAAWLVGRPV